MKPGFRNHAKMIYNDFIKTFVTRVHTVYGKPWKHGIYVFGTWERYGKYKEKYWNFVLQNLQKFKFGRGNKKRWFFFAQIWIIVKWMFTRSTFHYFDFWTNNFVFSFHISPQTNIIIGKCSIRKTSISGYRA